AASRKLRLATFARAVVSAVDDTPRVIGQAMNLPRRRRVDRFSLGGPQIKALVEIVFSEVRAGAEGGADDVRDRGPGQWPYPATRLIRHESDAPLFCRTDIVKE